MRKPESSDAFIRRKSAEFEERRMQRKPIKTKDIGRKGKQLWLREAWTFMPQRNLRRRKIFVVERFRKAGYEGTTANPYRKGVEYRIGYFVLGRIGRMRNHWTWGQYCPFIPKRDLPKLLAKAQKEGTLL